MANSIPLLIGFAFFQTTMPADYEAVSILPHQKSADRPFFTLELHLSMHHFSQIKAPVFFFADSYLINRFYFLTAAYPVFRFFDADHRMPREFGFERHAVFADRPYAFSRAAQNVKAPMTVRFHTDESRYQQPVSGEASAFTIILF